MSLHVEANVDWAHKYNSSMRKCHEMILYCQDNNQISMKMSMSDNSAQNYAQNLEQED